MALSIVDVIKRVNTASHGNIKAFRDLLLELFNNGIAQTQKFAVVATGSTNADAAACSIGFNVVTAANATKGVILPAARDGQVVTVKNNAAAVLKVYPPALAGINALTVTTGALSLAANVTATFYYDGLLQVWSFPLLPS